MQLESSPRFSSAPSSKASAKVSGVARSAKRTKGKKLKVSQQDLADLTAQLAIMVRSGVDVASALQSLAKQSRVPAVANILREIHGSVIAGRSFSEALRDFPEAFDEAFVATVASGEATGHMANVLDQLSELLRSQLRLSRTLRAMLIYPALLMAVFDDRY